MSESFSTRESTRHRRQISLGDSSFKPLQSEILTLTHYQLESSHKSHFITNTQTIDSVQNRVKTEHTPNIQGLNIKLTTLSKVLPAINRGNLSIARVQSLNKEPYDYIVSDNFDPKTNSSSSSMRIALSEYDGSPKVINSNNNISRAQVMGSPNGQEDAVDWSYIKQKSYIEQNPHFSKYNKSINTLDRLDASKFILPKDLFQYEDQKGINQRVFKKLYLSKKDEALLPGIIKTVKENSPESIELTKDKSFQFKIDASGQVFPVTVNIKLLFGAFEIFVSKSHSMPGPEDCDLHNKDETFQVDFSSAENLKYVYFRLRALEDLQGVITISFHGKRRSNRRSISTLNFKSLERKQNESSKKPVYEFFHENMNQEEVKELREIIKEIKKEKKAKSLSIANNQNKVEKNIQIAQEYKEAKKTNLYQMAQKQAVLAFNSKIKKDRLETERIGQKLYISVRHDMKKLEEGWKESEAKRKQDKLFNERTWPPILALMTVIDFLAKTKSEIKSVKLKSETQDKSARKIQKRISTFLYTSITARSSIEVETDQSHKESDILAKILIGMYQATNAVALVTYRRKKMKAVKLIGRMFREMHSLDPVCDALNSYVDKVIMVQTIWRSNREIFYAQVEVFLICWQKYCRILVQEEQKKRRKDNTEAITKMNQEIVKKYAKKFIMERRKIYQEALSTYNESKHKSVFINTEIFEHSEPAIKESNQPSVRPSLTKSIQISGMISKKKDSFNLPSSNKKLISRAGSKILSELDTLLPIPNPPPTKPKLRIRPTRPELKQIFMRILKEMKQL